jgi:hypothetical protein
MPLQRVSSIAPGYEDVNDHAALRHDVAVIGSSPHSIPSMAFSSSSRQFAGALPP